MIDLVRLEKNKFLEKQRPLIFGTLFIVTMVTSFLSSLFTEIFILSYLIQTFVFAVFASLQLTILFTIRDEISFNIKELLNVFKQYGIHMMMLGLMVEAVGFILTNIAFLLISPFVGTMSGNFSVLVGALLSFMSLVITHFVAYLYLFAPFYIVDRNMIPFNAFTQSYRDTKGLKSEMFKLELPYILIIFSATLTAFLISSIIPSQLIATAVILVSSFITIYFSVDLYTQRTVYYEKHKETTVL